MRKSFFLIPIIGLFTILSNSCKKYEEGPRLSVASKKGRVANTWKYDEILRNNQPTNLSADELSRRLTLSKDGKATFTSNSTNGNGTWEFDNDKEDITLNLNLTTGFLKYPDIKKLKIIRLKNDELWVQYLDNNNNTIEYHLESVD